MHRAWMVLLLTVAACSSSSSGGNGGAAGAGGGAGATASGDGCTTPVIRPRATGPACDPLAPSSAARTIDAKTVVGAGRAADGTTYVLTEETASGAVDLYVSTPSCPLLVERHPNGTGSMPGLVVASYVDTQGTLVTVQAQDDAAGKKMGVAHGPIAGKTFDIGTTGEALTLVDAAVATAQPAEVDTTYMTRLSATAPDGRIVVLVAPTYASGYSEFRLFFGPKAAVAERTLTMVTQSKGIPSTWLVASDVDGMPVAFQWSDTTGTMVIGSGAPAPLVIAADQAIPSGVSFNCF
jgi:hypothetical protein